MNVAHLLIGAAAERPDAAAIIERGGRRTRTITFGQLEARSARAAAMLVEAGLGPGDAILVFVPMSIELYVALIAILRVGAVATFLDPSAGRGHVARCCEMLPPAGLVAVSRAHLLGLVTPAMHRIPRRFSLGWPVPGAQRWERLDRFPPEPRIADRAGDDAALVTFTSGSTGRPKAAVRTHAFLAAQHAALHRAIELAPGQVDLATLPIFSLGNLASGVTSVVPDADLRRPGRVRAGPVLRQLREHGVTRAVASPAFFERLLAAPRAAESMQGFDRIYTGGAPVFPGLMRRLQQAVPAARVVAVYGSTEAEPIAHVAWDEVSAADVEAMFAGRGLLAGRPVPEIRLRVVVDTFGRPMPAMTGIDLDRFTRGTDQPGEIVVCGPHVLGGYLRGEGDAATKFRVDGDVWHRTGDAGYLDGHGRLWLLGRAQARIVDEHGTVYPFTVECAASEIEGVRRSALVQVDGRRVLAVEVAAGDVRRQVAARLAWAHLHAVRVVRRIPVDKRHNAKVDYPELTKRLGEVSIL